MSTANSDGMKLYCGGKEVTKEQVEKAIAEYKKKIQKGASIGWGNEGRDHTGWWLLPEEHAYNQQDGSIYPKAVFYTGGIQFHGRNIAHTDFTIRPCIQIKYTND